MTTIINTDSFTAVDATDGATTLINSGVSIAASGPYAIGVLGNALIVRNKGDITGTDYAGIAMVAADSNLRMDAGSSASGFYAGVAARAARSVINNDGAILGGFAGIDLDGSTDTRITTNGSITAADNGIAVRNGTTDTNVNNAGTIVATDTFGIGINVSADSVDVKLTNSGAISGMAFGVRGEGLGLRIENAGDITGNVGVQMGESALIINSGTITGATASVVMNNDLGTASITNNGILNGNVVLDDGADLLRNLGTINGDVDMGDGKDNIVNKGTITGTIDMGEGVNTYSGEDALAGVTVLGGDDRNQMRGGAHDDDFTGGAARDTMNGNAGADRITGGGDRDVMWGGDDADVFIYNHMDDSTSFDVIMDFQSGEDKIDLDALSDGNLAFLGTADFDGSGNAEVRYDVTALGHTYVRIDVDGDGDRDMSMLLRDAGALTVDDFIL